MTRINGGVCPGLIVIDPFRLVVADIREVFSGEVYREVAIVPAGVCRGGREVVDVEVFRHS